MAVFDKIMSALNFDESYDEFENEEFFEDEVEDVAEVDRKGRFGNFFLRLNICKCIFQAGNFRHQRFIFGVVLGIRLLQSLRHLAFRFRGGYLRGGFSGI